MKSQAKKNDKHSRSFLSNVCVVIRSAEERTEELCRKLILSQAVAVDKVFVVRQIPFSAAMETSFELGLNSGCKWTFCCDADVLLRGGSLKQLVDYAEQQSENVVVVQGFVVDKLFGGTRVAGNHLYRSTILPEAIELLRSSQESIRPESAMLNALKLRGWLCIKAPIMVGLHDFEQYYRDILRKTFVHAHKHSDLVMRVVPMWHRLKSTDLDFSIALAGAFKGLIYDGAVFIDKSAPHFQRAQDELQFTEKYKIDLEAWSVSRVDKMVEEWTDSYEYSAYQPVPFTSIKLASNIQTIISKIKYMIKSKGIFWTLKYLVAKILKET